MKILGAPVSVGKISFDDVPINMDICYNNLKKEFIVPEEGFYIFMSDVTLMRPVGVLMFSYLECKVNGVRKYSCMILKVTIEIKVDTCWQFERST